MEDLKPFSGQNRLTIDHTTNRFLGAFLGALLLSGCVAGNPQVEQAAALRPHLGKPVETLSLTLRNMPNMAIDRPGGRVFVFKEPRGGTMPGFRAAGMEVPTMAGSWVCTHVVETHIADGRYVIDSIEAEGC